MTAFSGRMHTNTTMER